MHDQTLPVARYRFTFRAEDNIQLPQYAGSLLRGQFGAALRRAACITGLKHCPACPLFRTCAYPAIFETPAPAQHALQKFSHVPNPYVIEPPPFGTRDIAAGAPLSFNVVLIGRALGQLPLIVYALQRALSDGLGKQRAKAHLETVQWEDGEALVPVWDVERGRVLEHQPGLAVPAIEDCAAVTLHIHTPLRLQHQGKPLGANQLSPRALITTLLRRASLLFELHADLPGALADPHELATRAEQLHDKRDLRWLDWTRYSSHQHQEMTLGGVVGTWQLQGDLGTLLRWLWLGQWLHVGKSAVMGMGGYRLEVHSVSRTART
ncbi:MAG: CRISPR system precrRNA processing endoribonuclease RAMP protein Cas6 [Burkholderiales bacterium]